ncbi:MAG TPA: type II toxin-antitoxin system VapC family toxin [bacterium]|nr:type II toxin-antitoxin system VapC family toxin [bacterium]
MKYLLDTHVISELFKKHPEPKVSGWLKEADQDSLFLSVLTLGEIRKGIEKMEQGSRKARLVQFLEKDVPAQFEERILSVDFEVAETWGLLEAQSGRPLPTVDALLAATALTHNLTLVTRNTQDFSFSRLKLLNPWT